MTVAAVRDGMTEQWTKAVVTLVLVGWWLFGPVVGYGPAGEAADTMAGTIWEHLGWMVSHGNVWHLAGNVFVLWCLTGRLHVMAGVVIAFLCSWLPVLPGVWELFADGEMSATVGFSGVLCGMIGVKWGAWCRTQWQTAVHGGCYWTFAKKVMPILLVGIFVPHINWSIHVYCVTAGLLYGRWKRT